MQYPTLDRRSLLGLLAASAMPGAFAQEATWPTRPVKFVNWSNPGGNLDIVGRILSDAASRKWNQPVLTDNRKWGNELRLCPKGYRLKRATRSFWSDIFLYSKRHSTAPRLRSN